MILEHGSFHMVKIKNVNERLRASQNCEDELQRKTFGLDVDLEHRSVAIIVRRNCFKRRIG